jgi:hypothetical protein
LAGAGQLILDPYSLSFPGALEGHSGRVPSYQAGENLTHSSQNGQIIVKSVT